MADYKKPIQKVCHKCKKDIPHLIALECGKRFKCPECKQVVDFHRCILITPPELNVLK